MLDKNLCLKLRFSFLQFTKGLLREKIIPPPHSTPLHRLPHLLPPIVLWGSSHFDTTQLLTRGCRAHRMMSSSPKPPSPQARSREILVSPAKSAFLSSQLPPSHVPPQTWLEDGTARRTNETKALGDAPQVPISSHPRSRRVVTRHRLCNQSRLLTLF